MSEEENKIPPQKNNGGNKGDKEVPKPLKEDRSYEDKGGRIGENQADYDKLWKGMEIPPKDKPSSDTERESNKGDGSD